MNVEEVFSGLSYGELSNVMIGNDSTGDIDKKYHAKLITYINEGLVRIYSRFPLKEESLFIELEEHITSYRLTNEYAESNTESTKPYKYIKDYPANPFKDDVIKILEVFDSYGLNLPINDRNHVDSLFTPQPNVLQVPRPLTGIALSVVYQARHHKISYNAEDESYLSEQIILPFSLEAALSNYIGYKVFSHMNSDDSGVKAQEFYALYEAILNEVSEGDLASVSSVSTDEKLHIRGFK